MPIINLCALCLPNTTPLFQSRLMASPQNQAKRRRVLSEIINKNPPMIESARRKSLGFDLVRIDHSLGSSIPNPPPDSTKIIKEKAEQNRVGSAIPSIAKSEMYNKYLQVSRSLSEKCKVNSAGLDVPFEDYPDGSSLKRLEELEEEQARLHRDTHEASKVFEALKAEAKELDRTHKRLKRLASEKETQIRLLTSEFETREQKVQAAVAHEAHMTDLRLREHQNKLLNDYNDAKFKLEAEVAQNSDLRSPELDRSIEELKLKKRELDAELQDAATKKEEAIRHEMQLMDAEIDNVLKQRTMEVEEASKTFQKLQLVLDQISAEFEALDQEVLQNKKTKAALELQVKQIHERFSSLGNDRESLKSQIHSVRAEILALKSEESVLHQRVQREKMDYLAVKEKFDTYSTTRRFLEHAIMGYSEKTRRYVRLDESMAEVHNNEVILDGIHYRFEKAGILDHDAEYNLEWELLIKEALKESNVSVLFCGSDRKPSMHYLLHAFNFLKMAQVNHKDWSFEVNLQSIFVDEKEVYDLLNASTDCAIEYPQNQLSIISQRMLVNTEKDLRIALKDEGDIDKMVLHILTIDGTNAKTNQKSATRLSIANITNLRIKAQVEVLQNAHKGIGKLINHLLASCKSVCACDIVPGESTASSSMLKAVENLRS